MISRRTLLQGAAAGLAMPLAGVLKEPSIAAAPDATAGEPAPFGFAICNETFQKRPFDRAVALAAECGYRGLEIAPFTLCNRVTEVSAARRTEIRRTIESAGMKTVGLHWMLAKTQGLHLTSPDAEVRRRTLDYLRELAQFSADLGGRILVFGSPKQRDLLPGVSRQQALGHAGEVLEKLVPTLERTDTLLAIEPLAPGDTTFLTTAAEALELIARVGSPRCHLHLDCKAMSSEAAPIAELIRRHRAAMVHFHANDPNGQGPGFGRLDFVPILAALRAVNYRGWVSVEVFDGSPGEERLARESIGYLRRCLRST